MTQKTCWEEQEEQEDKSIGKAAGGSECRKPANTRKLKASAPSFSKEQRQAEAAAKTVVCGRTVVPRHQCCKEAAGSAAAAVEPNSPATFSTVATSTSSDTAKSTPMTVPVAGCDASTNAFEEDAKGWWTTSNPKAPGSSNILNRTTCPDLVSVSSAIVARIVLANPLRKGAPRQHCSQSRIHGDAGPEKSLVH